MTTSYLGLGVASLRILSAVNPLPEMSLECIRFHKADHLKIVLNYRMDQIPLWNCNTENKVLLTLDVCTRVWDIQGCGPIRKAVMKMGRWFAHRQPTSNMQPMWRLSGHKLSWRLSVLSLLDFLPPRDCVLLTLGLTSGIQPHPFQALRHDLSELKVHSSQTLSWVFYNKEDLTEMGQWLKLQKAGASDPVSQYKTGPQKACGSADVENWESNETHLCPAFSTCCLARNEDA